MRFFFLLVLVLSASLLNAQDESLDYSRLPDKVFLHLDRNLYAPGDTIWAKAYAFHRNNMRLSHNSYALHIQILSEEGLEVDNYKMLLVDGMGYGQIPIYETMSPGFYQIIAHTGHMKNFGERFFWKSTFEIRNPNREVSVKSYFDKEAYGLGDTAKITFHLYDEFQLLLPKQRFRYELVHDDKTLKRGVLRTSDDGKTSVSVILNKGSKQNPPYLKLSYYSESDGDISKAIKVFVPMQNDVLNLRFYPESGDLIEGLTTKVAFEALDELGEAVEIEGVLQENSHEILNVASLHKGRGYFSLSPKDAHYSFKVTKPTGIDSIFWLPRVLDEGLNISYQKQDKEKIYLNVSHNYGIDKRVKLWVSQNDQILDIFEINVNGSRGFTIPKMTLPPGIVTFTLTDEDDVPKAERLVCNIPTTKDVDISILESVYSQRKKVSVKMALTGESTRAHFSVAVVDSVLAKSPNFDCPNIRSYALLGSELRGYIRDANAYLEDSRQTENFRDLLMLTRGWRRFNWIYNMQQLDSMLVVDFNMVNGVVTRNRKPHVNAKLTAMVLGNMTSFTEFTTNEKGRFSVNINYEDRSSQKLLFIAKSAKGKDNVNISLANTDTVLFASTVRTNKDQLSALMYDYNNYLDLENDEDEALPFLSYETKLLKEVVIYGEHLDSDDEPYTEAFTSFSAGSVSGDKLAGGYTFYDYVRQASFRAQYDSGTDRIVVRSRGTTMSGDAGYDADQDDVEDYNVGAEIYLNDMRWGKDASSLDFLTKDEIAEIVVLDPESAQAAYGSDGEFGIILVRTNGKYFAERQNTLNRNMAIFGRFIASKEYYKPIYENAQQDSLVVVDNRITLHWEPFVTTNENGEASFEFYTGDIGGAKQIIIQGIDEAGNLYYQTTSFDVKVIGY